MLNAQTRFLTALTIAVEAQLTTLTTHAQIAICLKVAR
jgi:hypothetical protein